MAMNDGRNLLVGEPCALWRSLGAEAGKKVLDELGMSIEISAGMFRKDGVDEMPKSALRKVAPRSGNGCVLAVETMIVGKDIGAKALGQTRSRAEREYPQPCPTPDRKFKQFIGNHVEIVRWQRNQDRSPMVGSGSRETHAEWGQAREFAPPLGGASPSRDDGENAVPRA